MRFNLLATPNDGLLMLRLKGDMITSGILVRSISYCRLATIRLTKVEGDKATKHYNLLMVEIAIDRVSMLRWQSLKFGPI